MEVVTEERDLGVIFDNRLDYDKHIRTIVGKANRMLGLIKISFECMDEEIFKNLYLVLVRPLLEYCVQVWSPHLKKHVNLIEGVQERATRLIPSLRGKPYEQRLEALELTTLVERRFRGDMIETFKIMSNQEGVKRADFFQPAVERGDPNLFRGGKIFKKRFNGYKRGRSFSQRIVNPWNNLSREEVSKCKISGF